MKKLYDKTLATLISIVFILSSVIVLIQTSTVTAQLSSMQQTSGPLTQGITPNKTAYPRAFLSFSPTNFLFFF